MRIAAENVIPRLIILAGSILLVSLLLATGLIKVPEYYILAGTALAIIFIVTFVSPEVGLYILIFSMLFSPEIIVGQIAARSTLARGVTLRLDDFLLLVIGISWFARTAFRKDFGLLRYSPINKPILLFLFAVIISTVWGYLNGLVWPKAGFFYALKIMEFFMVYFMTVNLVKDRRHVRNLVVALILVCVLVSIYGIAQIPLGDRVTAPFEGKVGEPNTFGGYLVFMLSLIICIALAHNDSRVRWGMVPLLFIIVPLLFSFSRSSMVAFAGMYLALLAFSPRKGIIILGLIFMVVAAPVLLPQKVKERVTYTWKRSRATEPLQVTAFGIVLDSSTSQRIISYRQVSKDWIKHPILGYGMTGYQFMDAQFPRVLAETGLVGLIIFLWMLYSIFRVAHRTYKEAKTPLFRGLGLGLTVGLCALAVHGLGTNTFLIVRIMEPFWLTTGVVVRLLQIEAEEEKKRTAAPAPALSRV